MSDDTRVNDPATGKPYASPNALHKFVGWMWSKYSRKLLLKIGVVTAPVIGMVAARFGNTPSAQEAIGIGLSALVLGALDFVVSYVGKQMGYTNLQSLQKLSEEQEPIREQPAIPFDSNLPSRSAMFKAIIADSRPMTPAESKASSAAFWEEMKPIAKPTSPSDDEQALLDLRASMAKKPIVMPTGFAVESWDKDNGEPTVTYYDTKFLAIAFRDEQRANHIRANLL